MKKKCLNCNLVNFADSEECVRCRSELVEVSSFPGQKGRKAPLRSKILKRTIIFFVVIFFSILAFYLSMIFTSDPLPFEEKQTVARAVSVLAEKGFSHEVFLLEHLTSFRSNDHWLNASVIKENAYAATNFPFEIMTIYPDFFQYSRDD